jgi:putative sporulation protein YtaF
MIFSVLLLAISLSLDALGVGVVYGLRRIKIPLVPKLVICFFSLFYSGMALLAGRSLSFLLTPLLAKGIGVIILISIGSWIIIQAFLKKEIQNLKNEKQITKKTTLIKIVIKSLGITIQIIRNPSECDIDRSGSIDLKEALMLGLALSVDAIGAGIGSGLAGLHSMLIPVIIGLFQMLFLYAGTFFGEKFVLLEKINHKIVSLLPGILLIFLE